MSLQHCTFGYHQSGTSALDTFASQVSNGIYTNTATFSNPTVAQAQFEIAQQAFSTAAADYATYGTTKKTTFTNARKKLIDVLDLMADFVDAIANGDESLIILSGFVPSASAAQSNTPLVKIQVFTAKRTTTDGEIAVEIPAISNHGAINYFCICSENAALVNPTVVDGQLILDSTTTKVRYDYSKSRRKSFRFLTPGVTYYFYVFACNTVSVSPISDAKSLMAA
jgi:hypothetical protein